MRENIFEIIVYLNRVIFVIFWYFIYLFVLQEYDHPQPLEFLIILDNLDWLSRSIVFGVKLFMDVYFLGTLKTPVGHSEELQELNGKPE